MSLKAAIFVLFILMVLLSSVFLFLYTHRESSLISEIEELKQELDSKQTVKNNTETSVELVDQKRQEVHAAMLQAEKDNPSIIRDPKTQDQKRQELLDKMRSAEKENPSIYQ